MTRAPSDRAPSNEAGYALIEVIVSALIITLTTAGVIQLLISTGHASAEQRHRSQAYAIAQEDQARLRSMRIESLQQELPPRTVTLNGVAYEVKSSANFVSAKTGTTRCGSESSADYVQVGSQVSWPSMRADQTPVTIESIVSPVSGSVDAGSGGLAVSVHNVAGAKLSGVKISGSGPANFFGTTNYEGCVLFGGEPASDYIVTPSLPAEYIEPSGSAPQPFKQAVVGGSTAMQTLEYDRAGSAQASFFAYRYGSSTKTAAAADSVVFTDTAIGARIFGSAGGATKATLTAESLFPFADSYNVYGGACTALEPDPLATAGVHISPGEKGKSVEVLLPALYLQVKNSSGKTTAEKAGIGGARVTMTTTDINCAGKSGPIVRSFTTTSKGALGEGTAPTVATVEAPGVPTGKYNLCVSAKLPLESPTATYHRRETAVTVQKLKPTTRLSVDLGGTGFLEGPCP